MRYGFPLPGLAALLALAAALLLSAAPDPAAAQSAERCFAETGFCISGRVREFWEQNGGLAVFGFPTSPQREELIEGRPLQVQWFERNRLELHPENQRPYDVLLGRLGVDRLWQQWRDWRSFPRGPLVRDVPCRDFPETGHAVCGAFLEYFRGHGLNSDGRPGIGEHESIALFGLPVSDELTETLSDGRVYIVQWFERARLEYHPQNPAPYTVLLGLLGNEVAGPRGCTRLVIPSLDLAYQRTWMKGALGCPIMGAAGVSAARQSFEGGEMIWVAPLHHKDGRIFVRYNGAPDRGVAERYEVYIDSAWAGVPDLGGLNPPPGRAVPRSGFGKVWYENPTVRERLGWAYGPEAADSVDVEIFQGGAILQLQSFRLGGPRDNIPAAIVFGPGPADIQYIGLQGPE
jgi:hypothetical protein